MDIQHLLSDERFFANAPLFASVAPENISHCLEECSLVNIKGGEILLTPDSNNSFLYVIVEGSLEVRLDSAERTPLTLLSGPDYS